MMAVLKLFAHCMRSRETGGCPQGYLNHMPLPQCMENYLQTPVFKDKQEYRNYHAESNKKFC